MMNRYIKFLMLSAAAALLTSCEGDRYALSTMIPDETFGHHFQVRLDTPLEDSFRLAYWVRSDYDPAVSAPAKVMLYYSDAEQPGDDIDTENGWKLLDELTKDEDGLPASSGAFYLSGPIDLSETGQIRHLRFCVTESNGGNSHPGIDEADLGLDEGGATGAHTAIAEFKLLGGE